jgi:hypothetical protein
MRFERCRATPEEQRMSLPGDDLVAQPMGVFTHAITIEAPPDAIWPWIIQMGSGRAGWYAYDHIDNGGIPSARRIISELQRVTAGDVLPWLPGATDGFIVQSVMPDQALILVVPRQPRSPDTAAAAGGISRAVLASWALALAPVNRGRTRLISRSRVAADFLAHPATDTTRKPLAAERLYDLLARLPRSLLLPIAGAGHYVMESRMLRGVKRRAEHAWRAGQPGAALTERKSLRP